MRILPVPARKIPDTSARRGAYRWIMSVHRSLTPPALLFALALSVPGAGVFEALETTPQELSQSGVAVNVEALALLPLAADERGDLLAGWLAPGTLTGPLLASQWLELCGQPEAAVKVLDDAPESRPDPLQRTRLLYRNGRLDAAAAAFAECQRELLCGPFAAYPPPKLEKLLRPLVALGEWDETARFLAWLQPLCVISEWRSSVLTTRIDLALQQGTTASLLGDLAKESAVTRAIADKFLDLGAATSLPSPAPGTSVADLAWCLEVDKCTPELAPATEAVITSGAGTQAERRELFRVLARNFHKTIDRNRLLVLWMTREEEFIGHFTALGTYGISDLPLLPLCELAARHPNNALLNYLAGCNGNEYSPEKIIAPARACLWRALKYATLVARPLDPALDPFFPLADYYRHASATDPARFALEMLKDRTDPALLHQHLTAHPEFAELPVIDRFRYLKAAGLEVPAWELLRQIDWSQPANDRLGKALRHLVVSGRQPSTEVWAEMFRLWPAMLLGSPSKSAALIAAHSDEVFLKVGPSKKEMYLDWFKRLQARGGDFTNEVLRGCHWLLKDDPNAVALREYLGISPTAPPVTEAAARRALETRLNSLNWFIGPGISGFPVGYARDDGNRFVGEEARFGWVHDQTSGDKELLYLSHRFPGLRPIIDSSSDGPDASLPTALRLRALLPQQSPRATALDLAIHRKLVKAPADASDRAARHIDRLRTRNEPDFVLSRASVGASMPHGERARNPVALLELGSLGGTPAVVRRAANDLLSMGKHAIPKERNDEVLAVSAALAISPPPNRPNPGWSDPETYPPQPPKPRQNQPIPAPTAAELARARQALADCPDDAESAELIARSLGRDGDLAELRGALGKLRQLDTGSFFGVLGELEILDRFAQPGLADIAGFLALPPLDLPPDKARRYSPPHSAGTIHSSLMKRDLAMADSFRKLLIQQHWFPPLTWELAQADQHAAIVEWLAATLTAPPPEQQPLSPLRFPPLPAFVAPKPPDPYPQFGGVEVRCILDHQLVAPLIAAIHASGKPSRQLTFPYLELLETPTIETYRQVFGPIFAGQDAAAASALKKNLTDWLKSNQETQPLAAAVAAEPVR